MRSALSAQARIVALSLVLVALAFAIGGGLLVGKLQLLTVFGISIQDRPALLVLLSAIALQGIAFGGVSLGYVAYAKRDRSFLNVRVPGIRDLILIATGFLALIVTLVVMSIVYYLLGIESAENVIVEMGLQHPEIFLIMIPVSILLIGPGEELLFRGVIQGLLGEQFGWMVAVTISSVIFAGAHWIGLAGGGVFAHLFVLFALSLILGTIYEVSENLVVPALIHGAYNALLFFFAYLTAVYGIEPASIGALVLARCLTC